MEQLDEAFLVALAAYISAAEEQGDASLAGIPKICSRSAPERRHYCSVLLQACSVVHCMLAMRLLQHPVITSLEPSSLPGADTQGRQQTSPFSNSQQVHCDTASNLVHGIRSYAVCPTTCGIVTACRTTQVYVWHWQQLCLETVQPCWHAGRLSRIQEQVLHEVSLRLPPEMRVLDTVLRQLSRSERMSTLRQSATEQGAAMPSCDIKRIQGAALQLISDMEEKIAIPDRCLHATSCCGLVLCMAALLYSIAAMGGLTVFSFNRFMFTVLCLCVIADKA